MAFPTALQVLHQLLVGPKRLSTPCDPNELRAAVLTLARTARQREVCEYLIGACDARLGKRGGGGSLKYVLWWLRNHAGELYVYAAREALRLTLAGRWPLQNALPHLKRGPILAVFARELEAGCDWRELAHHLEQHHAGGWEVAVTHSSMRLAKVAFRQGYDAYLAVYGSGGVIMARRGLHVAGSRFGPDWQQVYPGLVRWRGASTLPIEATPVLLNLLADALDYPGAPDDDG